jgi:hypothetical protein
LIGFVENLALLVLSLPLLKVLLQRGDFLLTPRLAGRGF